MVKIPYKMYKYTPLDKYLNVKDLLKQVHSAAKKFNSHKGSRSCEFTRSSSIRDVI